MKISQKFMVLNITRFVLEIRENNATYFIRGDYFALFRLSLNIYISGEKNYFWSQRKEFF